ncbi:unnamed protein product [Schistosoma margrebowiei]|uniref:Protein kinase domain-containing protein n=1 Tax=Schistosoma margrebowiei TaxID=48269 RepID=A0AA84ZWI0_9TREM|nr:unnamed protein product [Schistosoma margrebowiei]
MPLKSKLTSRSPTSIHTPQKTLKFVIPPHTEGKSSLNHSTLNFPQPAKDSIASKANTVNFTSQKTRDNSDQYGLLEKGNDCDENPSNLVSTDDEVSSLILDVNNTMLQPTPCELTNYDSSGSQSIQAEDIYGFIFAEEKESSHKGETIPQQQITSEAKHTRSILKSRPLSPKTYFDGTYESFHDKMYYTLHGARDSVDLTTVRFQIGCVSPCFGDDSSSNEHVMNTCYVSPEARNIESPRIARKTVRFADEESDFMQTYPTSMNPLFSNVFPLRNDPDIDEVASIFGSDTPSSLEENFTKIPEINKFCNYSPTTSAGSNFISISIGMMPNQLLKPVDDNLANIYDTEKPNCVKIDEATNWRIMPKNEYTFENSNEKMNEYSTLDYDLLKLTDKMNVTSSDKAHPTTRINSSRINKVQGYADLLIGRPKLHDDFLIPRQQLLTNNFSLNRLFTHPFSECQHANSTTLSPQNTYRFNPRSKNHNVFLPSPQNHSLSNKTDTLETNQTQYLIRSLYGTSVPNNEQTYDSVRQSSIENKNNILLPEYPTNSNNINKSSRIPYQTTYASDYEGIDLSLIRNETPTTPSSPSPSSTIITVVETGRHRDHVSDTENCTTLVSQSTTPGITKDSLRNKEDNKQKSESSKLTISIQQKQPSQSSASLNTTSARLPQRRPRVCESSVVNLNSSDPRMIASAYEFESTQSEVNKQEGLMKFEKNPITSNPSTNQNVNNDPKACWFRLHYGYSEETKCNTNKSPVQNQFSINIKNQPTVFKQPDKFVNDSDNCDYDNVANLLPKCVTPSTFKLGTTPVVKKLFGPKLQYATYTQMQDVTQSLTELLQSEGVYQHQHQTKSPMLPQQLYHQGNKLNVLSALQPIPIKPEVFNQSSVNIKSKNV